jgi:glycosyltransferase involved in cell wall biosynthesis
MNRDKRRIIVLTSTYPRYRGDCEPAFVHELAKTYTQEFDVYVLAPHVEGAMRYEVIDGINVYRYRYAPDFMERLCYSGGIVQNIKINPLLIFLVPFLLFFQFLHARRLIKKFSIRIVHAHWVIPQGMVAACLKAFVSSEIRLVTTLHGSDLFSLTHSLFRFIRKVVMRSSDVITVVSEPMREKLREELGNARSIKVIPMGTDLKSEFIPGSKVREPFSFLFVGRLIPIKGVNVLINAFSEVNTAIPGSTLSIVGSGPDEGRLKKLVEQYSLQGKVKFMGGISHEKLPEIYQAHEVAVFPFFSLQSGAQEAFGLVMVEALGCGCSVIASDIPAARAVLGNGERGVLVSEGNAEALAQQMIALTKDPGAREKLERKGRAYVVEKFDWDMIGSLYREVLDLR